jgi:flagellar L-ring protein precursor FlgH
LIRLLPLLLTSACIMHPLPYVQRVRDYKPDTYSASMPVQEGGSLFMSTAPGLFQDTRAARLGDIITIKVDENEVAEHQAGTAMSREQSMNFQMPALFSLMSNLQNAGVRGLDPSKLIDLAMKSAFKADGNTSRSGKLIATLQARVKKVLPNGDLYLEGEKIVAVNGEDHHLYLSGTIRQEDVAPDNSVPSARVADAQVMYNGMGVLSDNQRQGWLARLFTILSPL